MANSTPTYSPLTVAVRTNPNKPQVVDLPKAEAEKGFEWIWVYSANLWKLQTCLPSMAVLPGTQTLITICITLAVEDGSDAQELSGASELQ